MNEIFEELKVELKRATLAHFQQYVKMYPNEDYYGYSLYSDDGVSSIAPVATRGSAIPFASDDQMYGCYRYGPHEWEHWDDFRLFDEVNKILKSLYDNKLIGFSRYREQSLATARSVLRELESEGVFGPRDDSRFVVLWLSDSADPVMSVVAKELNAESVWSAYASEYVDPV